LQNPEQLNKDFRIKAPLDLNATALSYQQTKGSCTRRDGRHSTDLHQAGGSFGAEELPLPIAETLAAHSVHPAILRLGEPAFLPLPKTFLPDPFLIFLLRCLSHRFDLLFIMVKETIESNHFPGKMLFAGRLGHLNQTLISWAMKKYRRLKGHRTRAGLFIEGIAKREPHLFVHWQPGMAGMFA
jgi:hypothetical protein